MPQHGPSTLSCSKYMHPAIPHGADSCLPICVVDGVLVYTCCTIHVHWLAGKNVGAAFYMSTTTETSDKYRSLLAICAQPDIYLLPSPRCWDVDLTQHFNYAVGLDRCKRLNDTSYKQHNQCWSTPSNGRGGIHYVLPLLLHPTPLACPNPCV